MAKKRRNVKHKAQDPPESRSPVKERGPHAQVRVRGQALPSLAEVSEEAGAQRQSSSVAGAKGSSRRAVGPPLKVLPIFIWSPSAQNTTPSSPMRGDVGNNRFGAEEGEDSLFTNAELASRAVLSILRDSDLKKVEALCVEEALALSLQGTVSVCPSTFFYPSRRCVNVIFSLHLVPWMTATYIRDLARRASSVESSAKAAKAYKAKITSLTSEKAELQARIQSLIEDVVTHKFDLKHNSTAKARAEDREKKAI